MVNTLSINRPYPLSIRSSIETATTNPQTMQKHYPGLLISNNSKIQHLVTPNSKFTHHNMRTSRSLLAKTNRLKPPPTLKWSYGHLPKLRLQSYLPTVIHQPQSSSPYINCEFTKSIVSKFQTTILDISNEDNLFSYMLNVELNHICSTFPAKLVNHRIKSPTGLGSNGTDRQWYDSSVWISLLGMAQLIRRKAKVMHADVGIRACI